MVLQTMLRDIAQGNFQTNFIFADNRVIIRRSKGRETKTGNRKSALMLTVLFAILFMCVAIFIHPVNAILVISVTINATSPTTINLGQQVQFSASAKSELTGFFKYQWYSNANPISGATSSSFSFNPTIAGTYNISATLQDATYINFEATSNSITVIVNPGSSPSVPEFPSVTILLLSVFATSLSVIIHKKKR